jgi:uncharacterized repeat protein (TIGR01451 family)
VGITPDNVVLYVAIDDTDFAAGDQLQFWNGDEWSNFGYDADRDAWFLGRDGAGGVSGFPIEAGEVFPIEIRVNFLPAEYDFTVTVESIDDSLVGVGGVYAEFIETAEVLPTPATISFVAADLVQVFDGNEKTVAVTTEPEADLDVAISFDPASPIDAGSYLVEAEITDPYFVGSASATLVIEPAEATVEISNLLQVFDGDPKPVTVTTVPADLNVIVTYDGQTTVPVDAGSYLVEVEIDENNYVGSATATLVIEPAVADILIEDLVQTFDGDPKPVTVTTVPAGLTVNVTYDGDSMAPTSAGEYLVEVTVDEANYIGSATATLVIEAAVADILIEDLVQTFDGDPKPVTVTTDPAGLNVTVTYDGQATVPVDAGSYAVVVEIDENNYVGSATATLVIEQAVAEILIEDLVQTFDGDPKPVTVTTVPAGLAVNITYDGDSMAPTDAGEYLVEVTVDEANYIGSDSATLVIEQAVAEILIEDLVQTFDGDPKPVTVTTVPAGLAVNITYDGDSMAPTDAGEYLVEVTVDEANYIGSDSATLVIEQAVAKILIEDLVQTFDGDPKPVTVTTVPAGLTVIVTYDGDSMAPTNVGEYLVEVTVDEANYVGSDSATLVIEQATQQIDFGALPDRTADDSPFMLSATASSGLAVEFALISGPATVDGNEVTLTGDLGEVVIEATQPGDDNWLPADAVQQSFEVTAGAAANIEAASAILITGQAGEPVAAEDLPVVLVTDSFGNAVAGVTVGFEVVSGGGSLSGAVGQTDADGQFQLGGWTLGSAASQVVEASAPGLDGSPVAFTAEVGAVADVQISIDDNRETIEVGERNTYVIVVSNAGPSNVDVATVSVPLPGELDASSADWSCIPANNASCSASGQGEIDDSVTLPAGSSLVYILEADVLLGPTQTIIVDASIELGESVTPVDPDALSDSVVTQVIVTEDRIFRDRFEEDDNGPTGGTAERAQLQGFLQLPQSRDAMGSVETLLSGRDRDNGTVFRAVIVEAAGQSRIRLSLRAANGEWAHSNWQPLQAEDRFLAFDFDADSGLVILAGEQLELLVTQPRNRSPLPATSDPPERPAHPVTPKRPGTSPAFSYVPSRWGSGGLAPGALHAAF